MCDHCNISDVCPQYVKGSSCAFELGVEFRTSDQRRAASQTLLEVQYRRVMGSVMEEELRGGELSPTTGREMDRLYKMLATEKQLDAPLPDGPGLLSKMFGATVGQAGAVPHAAHELGEGDDDEPQSPEEDDIFDAEIEDEEGGEDYEGPEPGRFAGFADERERPYSEGDQEGDSGEIGEVEVATLL